MRDELQGKMHATAASGSSSTSVRHPGHGDIYHKIQKKEDEIERLRKQGVSLREATQREAEPRETKRSYEFAQQKQKLAEEYAAKTNSISNQIKIKWKRNH